MTNIERSAGFFRSSRVVGALVALVVLTAACSDAASITGAVSRDLDATLRQSHDFAVLANAAATCTDGSIVGDVGTDQATPTGSFTQTNCPVAGTVHIGDGAARAAYAAFLATYADLAPAAGDTCTMLTGTLDGVTLAPGTYCFDAAAALTGTLTLDGSSNDSWIFKIGTSGTGALTGTNFNVVLVNGALACNVTWWVAQAATMTTSNFVGNILAGAAITLTGGTFYGNTWSMADVTITGTNMVGCATSAGSGPGGNERGKCNQGVGNGPEGCDPGNSNHRRPSNDELGGVPGKPGRGR
jgi:hypothetical protein